MAILLPSTETQSTFPPYNFYRDYWRDIIQDAQQVAQLRTDLVNMGQQWKKRTKTKMAEYALNRRRIHVLRYMMYQALEQVSPRPAKYVVVIWVRMLEYCGFPAATMRCICAD